MSKMYIPLIIMAFLWGASPLQAQDWANLGRYREANAQLGPPKAGEQRVVFMGNSITEGWVNAFPDYFTNNNFIGRGISGQTTPQMLVRFRADVIQLQPAAVVILAGTNDIAGNTGPSTIEMIADNIFSMAELATAHGIKVILCSVLPVYDYPWRPGLAPAGKIIALNALVKAYAAAHGHTYLDYHSAMADERQGLPKVYADDEVHPTRAGYERMMELCTEAVKQALDAR